MKLIEYWKTCEITGLQISQSGRVRTCRHPFGDYKGARSTNGYYRVKWPGTNATIRVHSLVHMAFIGPLVSGCHVDHINHDREDNRASNLQLLAARENCAKQRPRGSRLLPARVRAAVREERRRRYGRNRERELATWSKWYAENRERYLAQRRDYRAKRKAERLN